MRGTDPIKSTWVYPKLILWNCYYLIITIKYTNFVYFFIFSMFLDIVRPITNPAIYLLS
jgi:hypothetical protein